MTKVPTNKLSIVMSRKKTRGRTRNRGEDGFKINNLDTWYETPSDCSLFLIID
jgi:hypothetical protein